jgi:YbgC/YbaW family acyl-CoA thioester hydrolase
MFETRFTAEWGDCDEAGIVFYPNYFCWIDCAFQRLLRDRGLSQREIRRRYGAVTPLVNAGAQFRAPVRYDEELAVVEVAEWQERRFKLCYRISRGTDLAVEAFELRAWALVNGEGRLRSAPVDPEFRRLLA